MPVFDPGVPWLRGTATLTNGSTTVETDGVITLNEILEGDRLYVMDGGERIGPFEIVGGEGSVVELREAFEGSTGSYAIAIDRNPITPLGARILRDVSKILSTVEETDFLVDGLDTAVQTAEQARDEAVTAKDAAQNLYGDLEAVQQAAGQAQAAQGGAEDAKAGAEQARADAQDLVAAYPEPEEVHGAAATAAALEAEIESRREALDGLVVTDSDELSVAFTDAAGNVAGGFDDQGRFVARIGQQVESYETPSPSRYVWGVTDESGAVALGVDGEGNAAASGLNLPGYDIRSLSSPALSFAIADEQGRVAFAVYEDGTTSAGSGGGDDPQPITHTVTWSFAEPIDDPSKELFLTWLTDSPNAKVLEYRPRGGQAWMAASSFRSRPFPELSGKWLHTVAIQGLAPDTIYDFRIPGSSYTDAVKTCPALDEIRVTLASDWQRHTYGWYDPDSPLRVLGDLSTSKSPDLLIFNGDFNFSDGLYTEMWAEDYVKIFQVLHDHWRTDGGVQIPLVPILGNHESRNAEGTGNANNGGDGTPGMLVDICSWSYTPFHESRFARSVATVRIRNLAAFVCLETDHTVPIMSQLDWYKGQLEEVTPRVAHSFTVGHVPPFHLTPNAYRSARARAMRFHFWPEAQKYAGAHGSMRGWLAAHSHHAMLTPPLKIDYDDGAADTTNDDNFYRDADGVVQIGCGSLGAQMYAFDATDMARVSNFDGEPFWDAGIAIDPSDETEQTYETYGTVQNAMMPVYNIWVIDITENNGWKAECLNMNGEPFFAHDATGA